MKFINCKNDTEKIQAIKSYCCEQIEQNDYNIKWYKLERDNALDYASEIHELEVSNMRFKKIIEIIDANEFMQVAI